MDDVLKDRLDSEVRDGFDGVISVIIDNGDENPSKYLDERTEVKELGFGLYEAKVSCEELKRLAENVNSVERNGTGVALG